MFKNSIFDIIISQSSSNADFDFRQHEKPPSYGFSDSIASYQKSILNMLKSPPFVLLMISYGLSVGVYYSLSTVLSQIIKPTFLDDTSEHHKITDPDSKIGQMGTLMVVAGLLGSVLGGFILDKFKKFKLTTLWCYIFTLLFMVLFTWTVDRENPLFDYFFIGILGFFMTGYLPIGFEFAAEITYPESEGNC